MKGKAKMSKRIYKVIDYNEEQDYHLCLADGGTDTREYRFDLTVSGSFDMSKLDYNKHLVGKTIEIGGADPYISIAYDVRIVDA